MPTFPYCICYFNCTFTISPAFSSFILTALSWIAPTLLMFITVEELRLAENKVRYVMRLLVCAVLCGLVVLGTNLFFDSRFGAYWPANFLYDLFYAAVLGLALESLVRWNEISGKEKFIHLAMLFAVVVIVALWQREIGRASCRERV